MKPGPPVPEGSVPPPEPTVRTQSDTRFQALDSGPGGVQHVDLPLSAELLSTGARYEQRRVLGVGGMGEVMLCQDLRIGREVAQKVMKAETAARGDSMARFLREARVQGQLEHPAVVPVYDLGIDAAGSPYFTMKRIRGLSLHEVLSGLKRGDDFEGRFNRRRLLSAFATVCLALDYAHSRGVIHRDLKPANIMLGDFGEVHVLDWGLARVQGVAELPVLSAGVTGSLDSSRQGELMGSPGYLSPEQARGEHTTLTPASDLYSLGAILFELLTWEPMVPGDALERIHATLRGEVERRPSVRFPQAEVAPELEAILLRATEPEAAKRFGRARELANAVERFLDGDRDEARRAELASGHLQKARTLLAEGDVHKQAAAAGEVMKAMALQPGRDEGPQLLAQLLTSVPKELPAEVEQAFVRYEARGRATTSRLLGWRYAIWVAYFPALWVMGVRSWWLMSIWLALVLGLTALTFAFSRQKTQGTGSALVLYLLSTVTLGTAAGLFGPFVFIPALVATNTMLFSIHATFKRRWLWVVSAAPIVVPWLLEKAGVLSPAYRFHDDVFEVVSRAISFPPGFTEAFLLVSTCLLVSTPSLLLVRLRDEIRAKERRLYVHSWLLKHLTNASPGPASPPSADR